MNFKNFVLGKLHHYRQVIFIIVIAIIAAFLFWYSLAADEEIFKIVSFFEHYVKKSETLGIFIFLVLNAVSVLLGPFTSFPLVPISVVVWGELNTVILLLSGWLLGDAIAYYIGRTLGYSAVRYFVSAERLDSWVKTVSARTNFYILFLFRLAFPTEIGYAFGLIKYNFAKYILLTFLAEISFAIILTYLGAAFIERHLMTFLVLIAAVIAMIVGALYLFRLNFRRAGSPRKKFL